MLLNALVDVKEDQVFNLKINKWYLNQPPTSYFKGKEKEVLGYVTIQTKDFFIYGKYDTKRRRSICLMHFGNTIAFVSIGNIKMLDPCLDIFSNHDLFLLSGMLFNTSIMRLHYPKS